MLNIISYISLMLMTPGSFMYAVLSDRCLNVVRTVFKYTSQLSKRGNGIQFYFIYWTLLKFATMTIKFYTLDTLGSSLQV